MKNWVGTKLLRWTGKRFDGQKTKIGGVGLILLGLIHIITVIYPDSELPKASLEQAIMELSGGFAVLGLGGKAEKLKRAVENEALINAVRTVQKENDAKKGKE